MAEALVDVVARAMKKTAADLDEYLEPEHLAAAALAAIDAAGYAVVPKEKKAEALGKLGALLVVEAKAKASVLAWMDAEGALGNLRRNEQAPAWHAYQEAVAARGDATQRYLAVASKVNPSL